MLFADDQFVIQDSEDKLKLAIQKLNLLSKGYNLNISIEKTETMAFLGKDSIRKKIVTDNKILVQVSHFNYLGCDMKAVSYTHLDVYKRQPPTWRTRMISVWAFYP